MPLIHRAYFDLFADYHQFYLVDGGRQWMAPEEWTDRDLANGAKVADGVVVVCPARNMAVPVAIEVFDQEPLSESTEYDHVVECSLSLTSGCLQVHECTGPEHLHLSLAAGCYRVRVLFSGLATIGDDGLEGSDTYQVQLWPSAQRELVVLKQWHGEWRG